MKSVLFFIILLTCSTIHAQNKIEQQVTKNRQRVDTNYVRSYKKFFTVGLFISAPSNTLTITPKDSTIKTNTYRTNLASIIGFTVGYKSIYAAVGFRAPIEASSYSKYGKSKFKSFSIGTQNTRFFVRFDFRRINGFYNSDSIVYVLSKNSREYLKRSDVNTKQIMVSGLYNFSWKKYSYLSSFTFSEHQLRTRVGFMIKSSVSWNQLRSVSSLINLKNSPVVNNGIQELHYTSFIVGPGMGLNLVIAKRIYFSMMLFLSYDFVTYKFIDNNKNTLNQNNSFTAFFEERVALGYHTKRFYAGIKFMADQIQVQTLDYKVGNLYSSFTFDVGYRFNAPGILKKTYKNTFTRFLGL